METDGGRAKKSRKERWKSRKSTERRIEKICRDLVPVRINRFSTLKTKGKHKRSTDLKSSVLKCKLSPLATKLAWSDHPHSQWPSAPSTNSQQRAPPFPAPEAQHIAVNQPKKACSAKDGAGEIEFA